MKRDWTLLKGAIKSFSTRHDAIVGKWVQCKIIVVEAYFEEFDELWDAHESIAGLDLNAFISLNEKKVLTYIRLWSEHCSSNSFMRSSIVWWR
jgi:hypothetical protein